MWSFKGRQLPQSAAQIEEVKPQLRFIFACQALSWCFHPVQLYNQCSRAIKFSVQSKIKSHMRCLTLINFLKKLLRRSGSRGVFWLEEPGTMFTSCQIVSGVKVSDPEQLVLSRGSGTSQGWLMLIGQTQTCFNMCTASIIKQKHSSIKMRTKVSYLLT